MAVCDRYKEYRIVCTGDGGCGKSALVIQFLNNHFVDCYDPTIEDSYLKQVVIDKQIVLMDILDCAGQEEYSAMRENYMRTGDAFMIVYSVTSRVSFENVKKYVCQILRLKQTGTVPIIIIVGNKTDLVQQREVSCSEGKELAKSLGCGFLETSARTRMNVDEAFFELVREIRQANRRFLKAQEDAEALRKKKNKIIKRFMKRLQTLVSSLLIVVKDKST